MINMGNYIYSAVNNAFYPFSLKSDYERSGTWPDDGVEVSDEVASEFMASPPAGICRVPGNDGLPAWGDLPPPTHEEVVAQAQAEKQYRIDSANDHMNGKQWPGKAVLGRLKGEELAQYNAWLDYLDALEATDVSSAPEITWPEQPVV